MTRRWSLLSILALPLAACAGGEPPSAQIGAATQAIASAERSGALQNAPVELQTARDKLAQAENAVRDEDNERARVLAEQAQVDAELAAVRAQSKSAQAAAQAVRADARALSGQTGQPRTVQPQTGGTTAP